MGKTEKGEWYKVFILESFYDDMIGKLVEETDRTYRLYFGDGIETAIFYKDQVEFVGEF